MAKVIEVKGYGELEFPDNLTDEQIAEIIQKSIKSGDLKPLEETPEQKAEALRESKPKSGFDWDPSKETREEFAKRSQEQMEREVYAGSEKGMTEKALLPRGFEQRQKGEKPTIGGTITDFASLPGRTVTGLVDAGVASFFDDLSPEEVMLQSMGETKGEDGLVGLPETVIKDPSTLIPGIGGAKVVKSLTPYARVPLKAAYEGGLEAASQYLDPKQEIDYGLIMAGGALPIVGESMKGISKAAAKQRFGPEGGKLLEKGLVPLSDSPKEKIAKEMDIATTGRTIEGSLYDQRGFKDAPEGSFDARLPDVFSNADKKIDDLYKQGKIREETRDAAKQLIEEESIEMTSELGPLSGPLFNRSELWLKESSKDSPRGLASKILFDESQDLLAARSGKSGARVKELQELQGSVQEQPSYGIIQEIIKSQPVMLGVHGAGDLLERGSFGLSPEAAKALYGQVMAEQ